MTQRVLAYYKHAAANSFHDEMNVKQVIWFGSTRVRRMHFGVVLKQSMEYLCSMRGSGTTKRKMGREMMMNPPKIWMMERRAMKERERGWEMKCK